MLSFVLALVVAGSGGEPPKPELTLREVRQAFLLADRDRSGAVDAKEARRFGLGKYSLRFFDADSSGTLDLKEAIVARRQVACAEGRKVSVELAAEVTRILAERRAKEAARKKGGKSKETERGDGPGPSELRRRSRREP